MFPISVTGNILFMFTARISPGTGEGLIRLILLLIRQRLRRRRFRSRIMIILRMM